MSTSTHREVKGLARVARLRSREAGLQLWSVSPPACSLLSSEALTVVSARPGLDPSCHCTQRDSRGMWAWHFCPREGITRTEVSRVGARQPLVGVTAPLHDLGPSCWCLGIFLSVS